MYYILMPTRKINKPHDLIKTLLVINMYDYFVTNNGDPMSLYGFAPTYEKALEQAVELCKTYEETQRVGV